MKLTVIKTCFLLFAFNMLALGLHSAHGQLAKLVFHDPQSYKLNLDRGGPRILTPFSKVYKATFISEIIPFEEGFIKYNIIKGEVGSTKKGPYLALMRLDKNFHVKEKTDIHLLEEDITIHPIATFQNQDQLHIVTGIETKDQNRLSFSFWKVDLKKMAVVQKNVALADFPFNSKKDYDFRFRSSKDKKQLALMILEQGTKKEQAVLHCMQFNDNGVLNYKKSMELPFKKEKGTLKRTEITKDGVLYTMLHINTDKKGEDDENTLLAISKTGHQFIPMQYNGELLGNTNFNILDNNVVHVAGLTSATKKGYVASFVRGTLTSDNTLTNMKEEVLQKKWLNDISKADDKGIKQDYHIRELIQRPNGTMDVVLNYCKQETYTSNDFKTTTMVTTIADILVFSYQNDKLVSTLAFQRDIDDSQRNGFYTVNVQNFSVPVVAAIGNDLYLMYVDNQDNLQGPNNMKKLKSDHLGKADFVMAKISPDFKTKQQHLVSFHKNPEFPDYYNFEIDKLGDKAYILSSDKARAFSKTMKLATALLTINE